MLTIRRFQKGDEEILSVMIRRTLREVNYTSPKSELDYLIPHYSPETMVELSETGHTYVLEEDGQIIGSGTILDTARLRYDLSHRYHIAQKNIHAYVYGEHGDTSFIPWSLAQISGCPLSEYEDMMVKRNVTKNRLDPEQTLKYVQKSGGEIIAKKGATFYAVSASVNKILGALVAAYDSVATVSSMMHGEYGIEDVCISTMTIIGPNGVKGKVPVELTYDEQAKLRASADALKEVIASLDI